MLAGIGGIFLYSKNPKQLGEWYTEMFEIKWETYSETCCYTNFWYHPTVNFF